MNVGFPAMHVHSAAQALAMFKTSGTRASVSLGGECTTPDVVVTQEFYAEVRDVDRNNEVLRIIGAFRLNGFEQLGLRFDATPEDIRKAYRKLSLLVHPDKCSHPQAKAAFEIVNAASKQLQDDDRRRELVHVLNLSRGGQHCRLASLQSSGSCCDVSDLAVCSSCDEPLHACIA
jgi:DnaJ domain